MDDLISHWSARIRGSNLSLSAYAACAGMLIGIGFPYPDLWISVFAGIALFYFVSIRAKDLRSAACAGYIAGSTFLLFTLAPFFFSILPLDWFGIGNGFVQVSVVVFLWLLAAALFGILFCLCAFVLKVVHTDSWFDILLFPSLWVLSELSSSFIFYITQLGPGSFPGLHMTLWYVGYLAASDSAVLQLAALGGVYALSFFIVACGALLARFVLRFGNSTERKNYSFVIVGIIMVIFVFHAATAMKATFHQIDTSTNGTYVGVVSRYMPPMLFQSASYQEAQFNTMTGIIAPLRNVEILVLPEDTAYLRALDDSRLGDMLELFQKIGRGGAVPVVVDSQDTRAQDGSLIEQTTFFRSVREKSYTDKQFLLPFGEYIPNVFRPLFELAGGKSFTKNVELVRVHTPGSSLVYKVPYGISLGVRFCDEVMSPELYRTQVRQGASLLVNVSSLSWFHGSQSIYQYMLRMAKVRAVENGRFLVQSSNMAPAFVIDDRGVIVAQTSWYKAQSLNVYVHSKTALTPYVQLGFKPMLVIIFVSLMIRLLFPYMNKFVHKNKKGEQHDV